MSVAWHEISRTLVFRISWQCIRSRNASHLCAKPFGTYRNVWSWNGFDDIKQHANEGRNRFDQAVTASGATMQAGPDSLAETKMAGEARKDSSFRECSSSDGCWHGDRCLAHGDYGCMPECIGAADDSPRRLDGMEPWMCAAARRGIVHWNRSYGWRHHEGLAGRTGYGT